MRCPIRLFLAVAATIATACSSLLAQTFHRGGTDFSAVRPISIAANELKPIMVTEFFHHGEITPDGKNVIVVGRSNKAVPSRILQLGPGDFCRLAFETTPGQGSYDVYYGGNPPDEGTVPPWTNRDGLLLETRKYKECNPNQLDSVRKAFESSERIGSDYVDAVFHSSNPFMPKPDPFLSHYSGTIHVGTAGTYGFFTTSQDCSFLLIDGKEVVSHPGVHGPEHQAKPGFRKEIQLSAGAHRFDYYHAATGKDAVMAAGWEPSPGPPDKAKPAAIPSDNFRAQSVGRVLAGPVQLREVKLAPDFLVNIAGDVPLPDNDQHLIGVLFKDVSPKSLTGGGLARWDFGDGQTSEKNDPEHVYLKPGLYTVKLTTGRRTAKPLEMVNKIFVYQPTLTRRDQKEFHKLNDYLPILETYNGATLDAGSLKQLVLAYQYKADMVTSPETAGQPKPEDPLEATRPVGTPEQVEARRTEVKKWIGRAVAMGKAAFLGESAVSGDDDLYALAQVIGPMARDQLGDSPLAFQVWQGAAAKLKAPVMRGHCLVEAADVAINDLVKAAEAKPILDAADKLLADTKTGPVASRLKAVWGDYYASTGDGKNARKCYGEAADVLASTRSLVERTAWQGAHGRSTEEFLKTGDLERAAVQIRQWLREFPADRLDGYVVLMEARYWAARKMYDQAVALNEQLQNASRDSAYADQLLVLTAECELARGKQDRAVATLKSILTDYPGSPLVPVVKDRIARIESGAAEKPKRPKTTP